ncbi:MAG: hypothetical protein M3Z04_05475 [Chloroflexota bacterium]|nr:hypothetical protein [Chloroflexota bacterium]
MPGKPMRTSGRNSNVPDAALWILTLTAGWAIHWAPGVSQSTMLGAWALTSNEWDITYPVLAALPGLTLGAIAGLLAGFGQRQFFRRQAVPVRGWVTATLLAMILGWTVSGGLELPVLTALRAANAWIPDPQLHSPTAIAVTGQVAALLGAVVGGTVGVAQWVVLRRVTRRAGWWIVTTPLAWALGGAVCWLVYGALGGPICHTLGCVQDGAGPGYEPAMVLGWLAGGLVVGAVTAGTLKLLLASRVPALRA